MKPYRVYLVDQQPITAAGFSWALRDRPDFILLGVESQIEPALPSLQAAPDAILVLASGYGGTPALTILSFLRTSGVLCKVILWTPSVTEAESYRALSTGAAGIIRRDITIPLLIACLEAVASGSLWHLDGRMTEGHSPAHTAQSRVTPREREVVELICRGLRNKEIAERLEITPSTVKVHLMHIYEKTGLRDRIQLAMRGRELLDKFGNGEASAIASSPGRFQLFQ